MTPNSYSIHPKLHTTHTQPSATSAAKNHPDYFSKNLNIVFTKGANLYPGSPNIPTIVLLLAIRAILANLVNLMPIQQPIIDTELIRKAANQFQFPSVRNRRESNHYLLHNLNILSVFLQDDLKFTEKVESYVPQKYLFVINVRTLILKKIWVHWPESTMFQKFFWEVLQFLVSWWIQLGLWNLPFSGQILQSGRFSALTNDDVTYPPVVGADWIVLEGGRLWCLH